MSSAAVSDENQDTCEERDASHGKNEFLRPIVGALWPSRLVALVRERFGHIENGEGSGEHGENDEGAAEVDPAESHLCQTNSRFYSLP